MSAQFGNPVLAGDNLARPVAKSPNYVPGVSGWAIFQDGDAEFNSLVIRGTFMGTDFEINSSGEFFYSGTPALGNLIASIAPAAGTDGFGNEYAQGISGATASDYASLLQTNTPNAALVFGPLGSAYDLDLYRYNDGTTTWARTSRNIRADLQMVTTQISALVSGVPETWHSITPDTGWTVPGGTAGQTAQYRLLADGSVQVKGFLTRSSIAAGGVNINGSNPLPAAYRPGGAVYYRSNDNNRAGVLALTTGVLEAFGASGGSTSVDLAGTYWPGA